MAGQVGTTAVKGKIRPAFTKGRKTAVGILYPEEPFTASYQSTDLRYTAFI
jgi:hypothetical protein